MIYISSTYVSNRKNQIKVNIGTNLLVWYNLGCDVVDLNLILPIAYISTTNINHLKITILAHKLNQSETFSR